MELKKAISIVLSLAMSVQMLSVYAFAVDDNGEIPEMAQIVINENGFGDIQETRALYDVNNIEVATCLDFENAYLIYLSNGVVVEYSEKDNSDYFGTDEKAYYGGPLAYYKQEGNQYVDLVSDESVPEEIFEQQSESIKDIEMPVRDNNSSNQVMRTSLPSDEKAVMLPHRLRIDLNYNTKGTCVALATTIMLFYYYQYISTDYIPFSFFVQYPEALHDYLVTNYFKPVDGEYGQTIDEAISRTNKYFADRKLNNTAYFKYYSDVPLYSQIYDSIVNHQRPLIMFLHYNPESISEWAINHAVVVHGLTNPDVYGQRGYAFYYVNDGAGHNDKAIFDSSAYITGVLRYKY